MLKERKLNLYIYCKIFGRKRTRDKIQEVYNRGENFVLDAGRRRCTANSERPICRGSRTAPRVKCPTVLSYPVERVDTVPRLQGWPTEKSQRNSLKEQEILLLSKPFRSAPFLMLFITYIH
jgi:hypothetical protein